MEWLTVGLAEVVLSSSRMAQFVLGDLPRLRNYESQRTSSYDRARGNGDYRPLKAGETLTLFDENGPAEIRHVWITMATGEAYHLKKSACLAWKHPSVTFSAWD